MKIDNKAMDLIVGRLALECHDFAISSGFLSHSVGHQLPFVFSVLNSAMGNLLDFRNVSADGTPCVAALTIRFSDEGYLALARTAKDRMANTINGNADIISH